MTTGTGVNDGQGVPFAPDGAGVAPDVSKGVVSSATPAPVPAPDFEALWRDAISALRDLGRQVRALREQVEQR